MSYQVLARKWRPQRFSEVVGQQHVLSALENGLREDRLHHAYLFSGTRGVGKTSIARLFAKGLNCENGITAEPCGECANCKAIEEGRFIDLIEIDAASRTKVEDTRELLDNVQYKPTVGRFKVYLIDEVHMLSRHSFNALLKTLEEPPEYVKFLLATTDPQKLPITILSRCMQFHLRALDQTQIANHLEFILKAEQIPYETLAVEKLAKAAQGSIRDSLSLTDQAIAMSNANITLPIVSQMLGLIDDHQPLELVQALALADGEKAMAIIQQVAEKGVDWQQLLSGVAETLHQIAMLQLVKHNAEEETQLHFLAKQISPEDVQFFYQLMLNGKKELPFAPEPRSGVEMTILRALAFHPKQAEKMATVAVVAPQAQTVATPKPQNQIAQLREKLAENKQTQASAPVPQSAPQVVASQVESNNATITSPALAAVEARKKLQQQQAELSQTEKKKPELKKTQTVAKKAENKTASLQERFISMVENRTQENVVEQSSPAENTPKSVDDEDYRWTWLNPELENQDSSEKPSDIKQAILQERTPELVAKTIALSCEQDRWCDIVNSLYLGGFSRQVALNSYLVSQADNHLSLVLKPNMAHLDTAEARQNLATALADKGLSYELAIGESKEQLTPLEIRRSIFEKLTEDAKSALLNDEKLMLLRNAFDAQIDESTIRAVADK
ncbi:DNA polymerase III subunit gamma/tau [Mannheimia sp. AT1]|uniref:DNA polymerase III subunit gamma/tau n=1 Tax=Mannheimia cairinae TaxID=3025936 RepID=A0ABT5MLS5_9PAST|nr:DNA polymerase III subunit gamma/tau [Mannheimia cairinae]MDD0823144.1 DNA polymerase III subunit gamma/tau [Mannheimia cairinae]MDD0825831.1 DNA polymerase III subunit gamma/tau [Mannheimia cairinae]